MLGFEAPRLTGPAPRIGRTIEDVVSHGKHLEITWDDDLVLHTHMRMTGSWHLYRRGERWRKPERQARVVIETIDWVAVCFNAPVVETYRADSFVRHPNFGRLGPDLCKADADLGECVRRLMTYADSSRSIAEVMLDQHVMCGVGNVYRCEVLWACEIHPLAPVGLLPQSACVELVRTSAELLRANLQHSARITTTDTPGGLAVYGRNNQPCERCGGIISVAQHGEPPRLLYWCPECQTGCAPAPEPDTSDPIARITDSHPAGSMYVAGMIEQHGRFSDGGELAAS
jgi:endonuclease-8